MCLYLISIPPGPTDTCRFKLLLGQAYNSSMIGLCCNQTYSDQNSVIILSVAVRIVWIEQNMGKIFKSIVLMGSQTGDNWDNWAKTKICSVWSCIYSLDSSGRVDRIFECLYFYNSRFGLHITINYSEVCVPQICTPNGVFHSGFESS